MEGVVNDAVLCQGKVAAQLVWSQKKIKEEEEEEEGDEYTLSASTISLGERIGHLHTHTHACTCTHNSGVKFFSLLIRGPDGCV